MPGVVQALEFLGRAARDVPPVCVLFGDEAFLKQESLDVLRAAVLGDEEGEFSLTSFSGDDVEVHQVFDCLSTVALFGGGKRLVIVRDADDFVQRNRAALENYAAKPKSSGVLVLEVASWPSNTRLAKAVAASGLTVECKTPVAQSILKWLVERAKSKHRAKLERPAAEMLLDTVEPELGLLDQELAKLALAAGVDGAIDVKLVRDLVGGWRTKTTWDMLDMATNGDAANAILQLDRLVAAGENPIALLAQIGSTLRRFAAAARLVDQAERAGRRTTLRQALETAGFRSFVLGKAEPQLRQLGRQRSTKLYRWLLDADLALKGSSSAPARARLVLETLIARLSRAADTAPAR
ncbi:MAG TPA: DNA polymerase III subunit delta [Pirellulales bacterium]|jgi:DNA polymerase-3 subunit delta